MASALTLDFAKGRRWGHQRPRWPAVVFGVMGFAVAVTACGSSRQSVANGQVGVTSYRAWTQGSEVCMAYTGFGDDNDEGCLPAGAYSVAKKTVGLALGCKIVFGLTRVPSSELEIVSERGVRETIPGRSARGWTYFVAAAPSDDSVASYQLFSRSGSAMEPPQAVHFDGPTSGTISEGDQVPSVGSPGGQTGQCLAY